MPVVVGLLLLTSALVPMTAAQGDLTCESIQDTEICIKDFSLPSANATGGDTVQLSLTVQNVGNGTGDAKVVLAIKQPTGNFDYHLAEEIDNVEPGESKQVSLPIRFTPGEEPGVHEINVMLFDDSQEYLYDSTGFYHKIIVEEKTGNGIDIVGWFKGLGIVAKAILAVIALLLFASGRRLVWPG